MSEILVNTIKKADGTGGLTVPSGSGTVATLAGGTFTGDITMSSADLVVGSNSIFIGGTGSANELDDYEEGTFTSTLTYDNTLTSTTPDQTLTITGRYTKVGNICHVSFPTIDRSGTFGGSDAVMNRLTLPFTSSDEGVSSCGSFNFYNVRGQYSSVVLTQGMLTGIVGQNTTNFTTAFHGWQHDGGAWIQFASTSSSLNVSITYRTA